MPESVPEKFSFTQKVSKSFRRAGDHIMGIPSKICWTFQHRNRVEDSDSQTETEGRKQRTFVQQVERRRLFLIFGLVFIGWICLVVALSIPEWFVLTNDASDTKAHIGYFERCFYNNITGKNCRNEIIAEVGAPLTMNLFSLLTGLAVILGAIRRLVAQSSQSSEDDLSDTYRRLRSLSLLSGIGATCGVATFTYLYSNFVVPVYPSFVLAWVSAVFLLIGGTIGYCLQNPSSMSPKDDAEATVCGSN